MAFAGNSYQLSPESYERERERGIPIGNLTSQLFANIYLNELDQFVKHSLRVKNYARYTDDFVIVANERHCLEELLPKIRQFLAERLALTLHPHKVSILRASRGVDFLGYVLRPHHRLLRARTRRRIFGKLRRGQITEQSLQSYLGVLAHANAYRLSEELKNGYWLGFSA